MAEFQEVIKNWERMCDSCHERCELFDGLCPSVPNTLLNFDENDAATIERVVTKWAKEHPVYPTWEEWLKQTPFIECYRDSAGFECRRYNWKTPIPADIAEKLGLDPVSSQ